jgi:hypothetical protein
MIDASMAQFVLMHFPHALTLFQPEREKNIDLPQN